MRVDLPCGPERLRHTGQPVDARLIAAGWYDGVLDCVEGDFLEIPIPWGRPVTLPRGFKANAEREALRLRRELGVGLADPLDVDALARNIDVTVVSAETLIGFAALHVLERLQAFAFSAATFEIGDRTIIVTNPLRTPGRLASDKAHELSRFLLSHLLSEVRVVAGLPFRTCKPDEEEQATTFGGTLLLPRPLLTRAASAGVGHQGIADHAGVTLEVARYRYNTTGVAKQAVLKSG